MHFPGLGSRKSPEKEIPIAKTAVDKSLRSFEHELAKAKAKAEKAVHEWIDIDSDKKYPIAMNAFLKSVLENENQDLSIYTGETDVLRLPDESIELVRELARTRIIRALFIGNPKDTSWGKILLNHPGENVDVRTAIAHMKKNQHSAFSGDSFISSKPALFLKEDTEDSKKKDVKDSDFIKKDLSFHDSVEVASLKKSFDLRFGSARRVSI